VSTNLIRPGGDSPQFVERARLQRYALAAALIRGSTVLEIGAGTQGPGAVGTLPGVRYRGTDAAPASGTAVRLPDDASASLAAETVIALEVVEHVLPHQQAGFLSACWSLTERRLIVSTPDADARHWYPQTDHFVGVDNPEHTREFHGWKLVRYLTAACTGGTVAMYPAGLDEADNMVLGCAGLPVAWWLATVDRE
jgi:hypothetical protein